MMPQYIQFVCVLFGLLSAGICVYLMVANWQDKRHAIDRAEARIKHEDEALALAAEVGGTEALARALMDMPTHHPESLTAALDDPNEEFLAWLAADSWPNDEYVAEIINHREDTP